MRVSVYHTRGGTYGPGVIIFVVLKSVRQATAICKQVQR